MQVLSPALAPKLVFGDILQKCPFDSDNELGKKLIAFCRYVIVS